MNRRAALRALCAAGVGLMSTPLFPVNAADDPDEVAIRDLKPGAYGWYPDRAPQGLVAIVVSLPEQRCFVYRNGVRIGVSTVSTGRDGHDTPTGVFTILNKDVDHHSSLYNDAAMPYSERLTWSGVALHAGGLPGYPSSHGCVHLPLAFAKLLFSVTQVGTPVIIADSHSGPADILDPGLILPSDVDKMFDADAKPILVTAAGEPVSLVASGADRKLIVLRGGVVVLEGAITVQDPSKPLGNVVYLLTADGAGRSPRWSAVSYEGSGGRPGLAQEALSRIVVDPAINQDLSAMLTPGATLLVTDLAAHPGTRTDKDFVILTPKGMV
ncbi:L,D-transpeptidase [Xanthobacter sp. DSM 24535]|uniref:L,D-transpeptidase n=1 Tax=Roseixanthobacter psychrophilus TaxID=3119917 RepID=UPI00372B2DC1